VQAQPRSGWGAAPRKNTAIPYIFFILPIFVLRLNILLRKNSKYGFTAWATPDFFQFSAKCTGEKVLLRIPHLVDFGLLYMVYRDVLLAIYDLEYHQTFVHLRMRSQ